MHWPLSTTRERAFALGLLIVWGLLYLPNLRNNPNWYSDEGEVMEMCSTTIHGQPRVGPIQNDFIYPFPYPPLYPLLTGALLRVFGNDIVVARAFGAIVALLTAVVLFWIGSRLRNKTFGFLCASAFLVYPEVVMNLRWVRPHPMAGLLALACVGFLIRYLQEKRLRDLVWAGVLCSLATATVYWTYPLILVVIATAGFVNRRHIPAGALAAGGYGLLFVVWYSLTQAGGLSELMTQLHRTMAMASDGVGATFLSRALRIYRNIVTFGFLTPTMGEHGTEGVDLWLVAAMLGAVFFPVAKFRVWLWFWLLALMYVVFKTRDNVPIFFYPATVFLPLLALGFAGAIVLIGDLCGRWAGDKTDLKSIVQIAPGAVAFALFGLTSLSGSLGHFRTKVDPWTIHSPADAEAVMGFVNANTTREDFVLVPKHLYWMVTKARKSMLTLSPSYEGKTNEMWPTIIPTNRFWFDCRWQNAKYLVLAYSQTAERQTYGFDAIYTLGLTGMRQIVESIQAERWPTVFQQGEFMVLANPRFAKEAK